MIDYTLREAPSRLTDWPGNKKHKGSDKNKTRPLKVTKMNGEILIFPSAVKAADYFGTKPHTIYYLVRRGTSPSLGIANVERYEPGT